MDILNDLFTISVPVKINMYTGYAGSDGEDTLYVDLEDVDFNTLELSPSVDHIAHEMAWSHAESYGEDTTTCGGCDGCDENDECQDPQQSDSIEAYARLFTSEDLETDIDNSKNKILILYKNVWIALENEYICDKIEELKDINRTLAGNARKYDSLCLDIKDIVKCNNIT